MSDTVKLNRMEVAPDAWIHGVESTEFRVLVDAKRTLPGYSWMPGKCQSATLQLSQHAVASRVRRWPRA